MRPSKPTKQPRTETKEDQELYCDRCENEMAETVEPTRRRANEPAMNLHTYRCTTPGCVPGTGRVMMHGSCHHTCNPHPDPAVRIQVRLPAIMGKAEATLSGERAKWDDAPEDLDFNGLRGERVLINRGQVLGRRKRGRKC